MLLFDTEKTRAFWLKACEEADIDPQTPHHAGTFAEPVAGDDDDAKFIDFLSELARSDRKRGTAHMQFHFEHEGIRIREPGDCWIVTTVRGEPLCVVRVTAVAITPYAEVGEAFAASEGEGDLSVAAWRKAHLDYFRNQCARWGHAWREDQPIVCESFELVYPD
jgi:uncharacterized protein YhfF